MVTQLNNKMLDYRRSELPWKTIFLTISINSPPPSLTPPHRESVNIGTVRQGHPNFQQKIDNPHWDRM